MIPAKLIRSFILLFSALIIQLFIPIINIEGFTVVPDDLIIFLTYIGFYYGRFKAILFGFLFGFFQDFSTQLELLGIMSLIKSIMGFILGSLALYHSIWSIRFRLFIIFIIYILHFTFFYFISMNGLMISKIFFIKIILCQAILCFCILLFFDKTIMHDGILK